MGLAGSSTESGKVSRWGDTSDGLGHRPDMSCTQLGGLLKFSQQARFFFTATVHVASTIPTTWSHPTSNGRWLSNMRAIRSDTGTAVMVVKKKGTRGIQPSSVDTTKEGLLNVRLHSRSWGHGGSIGQSTKTKCAHSYFECGRFVYFPWTICFKPSDYQTELISRNDKEGN